MKSKAGLRKIVKSVRGKKGTVRRSYWVKSSANQLSDHGFKVLGAALGSHIGSRFGSISGGRLAILSTTKKINQNEYLGPEQKRDRIRASALKGAAIGNLSGFVGGGAIGHRAGKYLDRRLRASNFSIRTKQRLGTFAALAGIGIGAHGVWSTAKRVVN